MTRHKRNQFNLNLPPLEFPVNKKRKWVQFYRKKRIRRCLSRIPDFIQITFGVTTEISKEFLINYVRFWESSCHHKGEIWTVKHLKDIYSTSLRFVASHSFTKFDYIKTNSYGLPLLVDNLMPLLKGNLQERRAALYLLQVYKLALVEGDPPPLNTITDKFHLPFDWNSNETVGDCFYNLSKTEFGEEFAQEIKFKFNKVVNELFPKHRLKKRIRELQGLNKLYVSPKKGPNGYSLSSIILDMIALKRTPLWKQILEYTYLTKNKVLRRIMLMFNLLDHEIVDGETDSLITSKLSTKVEVGGKTRLFAVVDWFTQSSLQGLHKLLFRFLTGIPEDGTFDHSALSKIISVWTIDDINPNLEHSSMDLSAATDRLPSGLQYVLMKFIIGSDLAKLWLSIMTERDFKQPSPYTGFSRYECGQPMGALSSWAMLAITHHVIVSVCSTYDPNAGKSGLPIYGVIGDDVAILGKEGAKIYHIIMDKLLHVPINPIKGYTCATLNRTNDLDYNKPNSVLEIAKRVVINGYEVTPGSPSTLLAYLDTPENFISLINDLHDRGIVASKEFRTFERIASLGSYPKRAMEYALFPPLPARPFKGGLGDDVELRESASKYSWYSDPDINPNEVEGFLMRKFKRRILSLINDKYDNIFKMNSAVSPIEEGKHSLVYSTARMTALRSINGQISQQLSEVNNLVNDTYPLDDHTVNEVLKYLDNVDDLSQLYMGLPISKNYKSKQSKYRTNIIKEMIKEKSEIGSNYLQSDSSILEFVAQAIEIPGYESVNIDGYTRYNITDIIIDITEFGFESEENNLN